MDELKQQIVDYIKNSRKKVGAREVADGLGLDHKTVKKAVSEMVNAGQLEFESFGGATFLKLGAE